MSHKVKMREIMRSGQIEFSPELSDKWDFPVSFSSEEPSREMIGDRVYEVILGHGPNDKPDLSRLGTVGAVLMNHDPNQPVATISGARINASTRRGEATIHFDKNDPESVRARNKVVSGQLRGISVRAILRSATEIADGVVRAFEWIARELSLTPTPVDGTVGVMRSASPNQEFEVEVSKSRQETTAMKHKLKDGTELSLAEIELRRSSGKDVELEDGTILRAFPAAKIISTDELNKAKEEKKPEQPSPEAVRSAAIEPMIAMALEHKAIEKLDADILRADKTKTADVINAELLGKIKDLRRDDGKTAVRTSGAIVGPDLNMESLRAAIPDALSIRARAIDAKGNVLIAPTDEAWRAKNPDALKTKVHERAAQLSGLSMMQVARAYAEAHTGRSVALLGDREVLRLLSNRDIARGAGQATTPSDFPILLENTMNKLIGLGWNTAPTTWRRVARIVSAKDYRQHNIYKKGTFGSMNEIGHSGEVKEIKLPDGKKEVFSLGSFANTFTFTDQMIADDDIGVLQSLAQDMGQLPDYTINEWFWSLFLMNSGVGPTMNEDTTALFDVSTHANYTTGAQAFDKTACNTVSSAMMTKRAPGGRILAARPRYVAIPPAIDGTVREFLSTVQFLSGNTKTNNPYFQFVEPIVEPILQLGCTLKKKTGDVAITGSSVAYTFFADPAILSAAVVAFLGGQDSPEMMTERPIEYLGTVQRVSLPFGVAVEEWRAAHKFKGEA